MVGSRALARYGDAAGPDELMLGRSDYQCSSGVCQEVFREFDVENFPGVATGRSFCNLRIHHAARHTAYPALRVGPCAAIANLAQLQAPPIHSQSKAHVPGFQF